MMQETLKSFWKTKVNLADYDSAADVEGRVLLGTLSKNEITILEEILYSPLQISLDDLSESLEIPVEELYPHIEKLSHSGLFLFDGSNLSINKEKRKFFEVHIAKFEEDFEPGMEFLQSLLKQIPIHILPIWYHIPRSSNNIFESLIEKYLITPQVYQRYIIEFLAEDELAAKIARDLFNTKDLKLTTESIKENFNLSDKELEELLMHLEYNLIAVSSYEIDDDQTIQILTPFAEWSRYILSLKRAEGIALATEEEVLPLRPDEYAFIEDMTTLLELSEKSPLPVKYNAQRNKWTVTKEGIEKALASLNLKPQLETYLHRVLEKTLILGLGVIENETLKPTDAFDEWSAMNVEKRSHVTFKHPHNVISLQKLLPLATGRALVEIQKSLAKVCELGWVLFDDYLKNAVIVLNDEKKIALSRVGRSWQYSLPSYTPEETALVKEVVLSWLFESGIVRTGTYKGGVCFTLTTLARSLLKE